MVDIFVITQNRDVTFQRKKKKKKENRPCRVIPSAHESNRHTTQIDRWLYVRVGVWKYGDEFNHSLVFANPLED